jgi:hypothetical protein
LLGLVRQIVPYNMAHNAEAEACDLLMEIEQLDLLEQFVDEGAYPRVCLYLTRCVQKVVSQSGWCYKHATMLAVVLTKAEYTLPSTKCRKFSSQHNIFFC